MCPKRDRFKVQKTSTCVRSKFVRDSPPLGKTTVLIGARKVKTPCRNIGKSMHMQIGYERFLSSNRFPIEFDKCARIWRSQAIVKVHTDRTGTDM